MGLLTSRERPTYAAVVYWLGPQVFILKKGDRYSSAVQNPKCRLLLGVELFLVTDTLSLYLLGYGVIGNTLGFGLREWGFDALYPI